MKNSKLAIIASDPKYNKGLALLLEDIDGVDIIIKAFYPDSLIKSTYLVPDVIVMDTGNNIRNEVEKARQLMSVFPESKILLLTIFDDTPYLNLIKDSGIHAFIKKPISKKTLQQTFESLWGK